MMTSIDEASLVLRPCARACLARVGLIVLNRLTKLIGGGGYRSIEVTVIVTIDVVYILCSSLLVCRPFVQLEFRQFQTFGGGSNVNLNIIAALEIS